MEIEQDFLAIQYLVENGCFNEEGTDPHHFGLLHRFLRITAKEKKTYKLLS